MAQYCVQMADGLFEALNQTPCGLDRIVTDVHSVSRRDADTQAMGGLTS